MIRATLDVNVLVSSFPARTGTLAQLIDQWLRYRFTLVLSEHILTGLALVWDRPFWRARFQADEAHRALVVLRTSAEIVVPVLSVRGVAEDEEDDLVLATAVAGGAGYLVTGDRYLQTLRRFEDVRILSPRQFLEVLESETLRAT